MVAIVWTVYDNRVTKSAIFAGIIKKYTSFYEKTRKNR